MTPFLKTPFRDAQPLDFGVSETCKTFKALTAFSYNKVHTCTQNEITGANVF